MRLCDKANDAGTGSRNRPTLRGSSDFLTYPDYPLPADELARQRDLESYGLLDTPEDEHLQRLARLTARVMEAPTALVSLVDGDRQWFLARHGVDVEQTPRDMAFCAHAICTEGPLVVPNALEDPRFCTNPLVTGPPWIRFYAGTALQSPDGHNLGTLCVLDREPRQLSPDATATLQDLAAVVQRELELRRGSLRCSTTGALQRAAFLQQGQRELKRSRDRGEPFALLLLDIDHFQLINQNWGHDAGDRALAQIAELLRSELRAADLLGRLGDGEFGLLFSDTNLEDALQRGEVLREGMQHLRGPYSTSGHQLQFSGGLTLLCDDDTRIESLLRRAEQALLLAQSNGHNQIAEVLGATASTAQDTNRP